MSNLKISVTQDHIDNGESDNCSYCPIALAIKDTPGGPYYEVAVGARGLNDLMVNAQSYTLPDAAVAFYKAFDAAERVEPFEFEAVAVEVPS